MPITEDVGDLYRALADPTRRAIMDELLERIKEAIVLCIEVQEGAADEPLELIGIQRVVV